MYATIAKAMDERQHESVKIFASNWAEGYLTCSSNECYDNCRYLLTIVLTDTITFKTRKLNIFLCGERGDICENIVSIAEGYNYDKEI